MTELTFLCPHCGLSTNLSLDACDKPARCTHCQLPFMPQLPTGQLLSEGARQARPSDTTTKPGKSTEQTVMTINPAAFREQPGRSIVLMALILVGLMGLIMFVGEASAGYGYALLTALLAVVTLASAVVLAVQFIMSRFESLTITTQRSIWARGVINRRTSEVQHDDIRNIQVQQNLIERLVGAGTIAISSAGQDDMEITISGVANPRHVIDTIRTYQQRMVKGD